MVCSILEVTPNSDLGPHFHVIHVIHFHVIYFHVILLRYKRVQVGKMNDTHNLIRRCTTQLSGRVVHCVEIGKEFFHFLLVPSTNAR